MELKDIIKTMTSGDYKERFAAEYIQLSVRIRLLDEMLEKWKYGKLDFTPKCSKTLLEAQFYAMSAYLSILRERAEFEGIEVKDND